MATTTFSAEPQFIDQLDQFIEQRDLNKSKFRRSAIKKQIERYEEENRQKKNSGK
jgi:metal-responsive CopG/Arc/MetJ family transcriptional regulator